MKNKKMVRIGWVPYCVSYQDGDDVVLGFWPAFFKTSKLRCKIDATRNEGFVFRILPVYAEKP